MLSSMLVLSIMIGCNSNSVESTISQTDASSQDAHDHAHDHGDAGPHGGHLIELDGGAYHAEWLHDDQSEKVTVILLDGKAEQEVAISAPYVTIDIAVGQRRDSYQLMAVSADSDNDEAMASRFELVSPNLLVGLKMGEGVQATLTVDTGDKTLTGKIEHQPHDEHGHHHH
jgi:hypothetical protein